jgi:hypothetical protein
VALARAVEGEATLHSKNVDVFVFITSRKIRNLPDNGKISVWGRGWREHHGLNKLLFFLFSKFVYSYVHTLFGPFLPTALLPLPAPPSLPCRTCSALFSNFVEEKT